jgi:hypothetical protein
MSERKLSFDVYGIECGEGWKRLYGPILDAASELNIPVLQVKEKFGQLRIYLGDSPDWLHQMVGIAEDMSAHVCEKCGKRGRIKNDNGWLKARCEECK